MAQVMRVTDLVKCGKGSIGIYVNGSPNVFAENLQGIRVGDTYVCPHCSGIAVSGSSTVFINNLPWHRVGDQANDCDGSGIAISGSPTVFVG